MPPITTTAGAEENAEMETETPAAPTKSFVGIIYPPPEIRNIVDKTANFVARNGPEFESRIRKNEANNPKFNFLMPKDPYHAYYLHKVKDFQEGKSAEQSQKSGATLMPSKVQEAVKAAEQFVPKDPPPEFEFMADPSTISAHDLDLLKLTAQFVARNGRQFLSQLMNRESRNYQFDFLKPQHSMFPYFTKLVEQYTKILIPPKDILQSLRKEASSTKTVLDQAKYRVEWVKHQMKIREREEAEVEKERVAYASIDWHDFVVVQTVDFQPHEQLNLPPPCCPKDVGARILAQQRVEATKTTQAMEMEMESDSDDEEGGPGKSRLVQPVPVAPKPDSVTVLKDYDPKTGRSQVEKVKAVEQKFVISPLTGEKVPADKLAEHMRLNTIDSQYLRQREQDLANRQEEDPVYAPGMDILSNIKRFADRRSDIFGTGAEETTIGRKMGEEEDREMNPKAVWDGQTAAAATKATGSSITIEEQIAQIHRAKGLLTDDGKERIGPKTSGNQPAVAQISADPVLRSVTQQGRPTLSAPPMPALPRVHAPTVVQVLPMGTQQMVMMPQQTTLTMGMGMGMMQMGQMAQYQMQMQGGMEDDDEPQSKRQKTEDHLIPEADFLRHHQGPIEIIVQVPNVPDKPEWSLNGKSLSFVMQMTDPISLVKTKIQEATKMPTSKQKLVYDNMFIKDSNTLAFYNMVRGAAIILQMKERGGRKK